MQACHFWIFSSRLVLACLQTGCGKSPQKSLKTACTFISLDLFSVSQVGHFWIFSSRLVLACLQTRLREIASKISQNCLRFHQSRFIQCVPNVVIQK